MTSTDKVGRRRAAAILARAYTVAHQYEPHLTAHTEQLDQQPLHALVGASEHADLLVVWMVGERLDEVVIGSVARYATGSPAATPRPRRSTRWPKS